MKKFGFYFKKGFVLAGMAMKGKGAFTRLLLGLYLVVSFFGKLFLFTRPVFLIADSNLAMMITEGHDFEINKIFEGINSKKRYSSLLLASLFVEGIALAAALVMIVPFLIWSMTPFLNPNLPPMIFMIIFGVAVLVLVIALVIAYSPMGFVTAKGKDLNSGDILFLAKQGSASAQGKVVGAFIVTYLLLLLIIGAFVGVSILLALFIRDETGYPSIVVNFIILVLIIVFIYVDIFLLSYFRLAIKITLYSVFFDSVEAKHIILARKANGKDEFVPLFSDDKEEIN